MRLVTVILLAALAAACSGGPNGTASDPAAEVAQGSTRSPLLLDGDLHGFEPSEELVRAAARLGDPTVRARAAEELDALPAAERVAVLRAGLRLRDPLAARTAAGLLTWNELDDWEQGLMTRLGADAVVDPSYRDEHGDRPDFGAIFECASGAELPYILERVAENAATLEGAGNLSILHKSASAEYLPHLARVAVSPVADVRRHALDMILTVAMHSDRHREDVAAALLGLPVEELRRRHPDAHDGVPPALAAVLALDELPFDPNSKFRGWRLLDARPTARDVAFLLEFAERDSAEVVAWVLRDVADPRADAWLRDAARGPGDGLEDTASATLLGVLAHRGDRQALARLVAMARAGRGAETLAVLLAVAPEDGRSVVEEQVFGDDRAAAFDALGWVRSSWEDVPAWAGIPWDDGVFEGFAEIAIARRLDGALLAAIGVSVPRCRTRELAAAAVAALPRDHVPTGADDAPFDFEGDESAFLETAAPDAYRGVLRDWARAAEGESGRDALSLLARLGDPASGPLLVEAARRGEIDVALLARSPCPEVTTYLRERGRTDFDAAIACGRAAGLPERADLASFVSGRDDPLPAAVVEEVRALLLDGRWRDAVARALAAAPDRGAGDQGMEGVGLVDDERVRAYLRRLQARRELGLYPWATAELANAGDPVARAEYEHALTIGRYRWGDGTGQIAFEDGLRALPFWIERMETNCCRFASIRCYVCDHWFDLEFQTEGGHGLSTPAAEARRFVARAGGRFVWSRASSRYLGGRYVPAPR